MTNISREAAINALLWYRDNGIDEVVADAPVNRLAARAPAPLSAPVSAAAPDSRRLADEAASLEALKSAVAHYKGLGICETATRPVFSDGVPAARVMIIGEAPGAEEDARGVPFCGASGRLFEKALNAIGLYREKNYYITNMVFWRPPANRKPEEDEIAACLPFVEKHIALIRPALLILAGATAVQGLLRQKEGITKLRGKFFDYSNPYLDAPVPALPVFHPSYLLRSPQQKKLMWQDLLAAEKMLEQSA